MGKKSSLKNNTIISNYLLYINSTMLPTIISKEVTDFKV